LPALGCAGARVVLDALPGGEAVPPGEVASARAGASSASARAQASESERAHSEATAMLAAPKLRPLPAAVIKTWETPFAAETRTAHRGAASELSR